MDGELPRVALTCSCFLAWKEQVGNGGGGSHYFLFWEELDGGGGRGHLTLLESIHSRGNSDSFQRQG